MNALHLASVLGFVHILFSVTNGCQYCGCYGTPNCDCYCPPWMYIGYDRIILEPARGQVSVSSSAAASVKYNKGAPQAYISSLSSAKADPKVQVNIVGGSTPRPTNAPSFSPTMKMTTMKPKTTTGKKTWDYKSNADTYGPAEWKLFAPKCGGLRQSPVDIPTASALIKPVGIKLTAGSQDAATAQSLIVKGKLKNNGRAIGFTVDSVATPIKLTFKSVFTLKQFHFHFGCEDQMGSEHSLDGQRFPGEIHLIFTNDKYATPQEAMQAPDGLVGIAFFMQYDENAANKALARITTNIDALRMPAGSADFTADGISLTNLVPAIKEGLANLQVYAYQGSLPTPPCFETVTWLVFRRPVKVNHVTLEKWRNEFQGNFGRMCGNFRPAQQLNGRKIIKLTAAPVATTVKPPSGPTQPSASSTVKPVSTVTSAAMKVSPTVPAVPSARVRAPLSSLEKVAMGPGRAEKAFAKLVGDNGKLSDDRHMPADARQELHAEPIGANKVEGNLKPETIRAPVQGINPAFAKVSSAKDSNIIPASEKAVEGVQPQAFKPIATGDLKPGFQQGKKPTVAPGMKRQLRF